MLSLKMHAATLANVPGIVWGQPGVGKTVTAQRLANQLGVHLETFIASQHEATDVSGVNYVVDGEVRVSEPYLIKRLNAHTGAWLFLDELFTSARSVQNALMRLILEREISGYKLNDDVRIIAASNFTDVAGNILPSTAMANRFVHIFHKPTIDEWIEAVGSQEVQTFVSLHLTARARCSALLIR